jgi:hypothetical protein
MIIAACAHLQPLETKPMTVDTSNIVKAQEAGYQIVNQNGAKLYCRKDLTTGTRIAHTTVCLTEPEWEQLRAATRATVDKVLQISLPHPGTITGH